MHEAQWLPIVRATALQAMLAMIQDDLAQLGIRHDVFFSERSLSEGPRDEVAETINDLKAKGLIYQGRLPPPKGKVDEDWEDREQLLATSTRRTRRRTRASPTAASGRWNTSAPKPAPAAPNASACTAMRVR